MSGPNYPTYSEELAADLVANGPTMWRNAKRVVVWERETDNSQESKGAMTHALAKGQAVVIYPERVRVVEPDLSALVVDVSMFAEVYLNLSQMRGALSPSQIMWALAQYWHGLTLSDSPNRWPERLLVTGWVPRFDPKFLVYRIGLASQLHEETA